MNIITRGDCRWVKVEGEPSQIALSFRQLEGQGDPFAALGLIQRRQHNAPPVAAVIPPVTE